MGKGFFATWTKITDDANKRHKGKQETSYNFNNERQLNSMRSLGRNGRQQEQLNARQDPDFFRRMERNGIVLPSLDDG